MAASTAAAPASIASRTPATLWLCKIVDDDECLRARASDENLFDIDAERVTIHRTFQYPRGDQTVAAQAAGEGCRLPMSPRGLADEPLASSTSLSVAADHLGVGAGFVNEHQLGGVKACLAGLQSSRA